MFYGQILHLLYKFNDLNAFLKIPLKKSCKFNLTQSNYKDRAFKY